MKEIAIVFAGGGLGAAARYLLSGAVYNLIGFQFPYGTLVVNSLGCFFIGFLMSLLSERFIVDPGLRLFLTVGILGGFTTYSTFSYETIQLLRDSQHISAIMNVLGTTVVCLVATWVGLIIGKQI